MCDGWEREREREGRRKEYTEMFIRTRKPQNHNPNRAQQHTSTPHHIYRHMYIHAHCNLPIYIHVQLLCMVCIICIYHLLLHAHMHTYQSHSMGRVL